MTSTMRSNRTVRILIVDDHIENLLALESVLDDLDAELIKAQSGAEALRRLLSEEFAVILLDVQMPGLDGFETATLIRAREKTRYTPIVFLTAINKTETHVTRGYSVGAVDYVFKPFSPELLRAKVSAFIDLWLKTRALQDEVSHRKRAEERLDASNELLAAIGQAQTAFITGSDPRTTLSFLLDRALGLTGSEWGFVGEIVPAESDFDCLKVYAMTSHGQGSTGSAQPGDGTYRLRSLSASLRECNGALIANSRASMPRKGTLPPGHPPLNSLLALPFYRGGTLHGVIGLVNRPSGYDEEIVAYLEPFLQTCVIVIEASRNQERRKQAEEEVRHLNDDLERRVIERTAELAASNQYLEKEISERKRAEDANARLLSLEQAARAAAVETQRRLALLAEASSILAESLDYQRLLKRLAKKLTSEFADLCLIDVVEPSGEVRRAAAAHRDKRMQERLQPQVWPPEWASSQPAARVLQSGRAELAASISSRSETDTEEKTLAWIARLGVRSYLAVPLLVRGHSVGVVSFGSADRTFTTEDQVLAEDLARRIAAALDNAQLFSEVQESVRRKDEFLAIMAHELRNPLAAISNADHLLQEYSPRDPREAGLRTIVTRQTRHLARMVDDLLDISRVTRGIIDLKTEPVDLSGVVQRSVEASRLNLEARQHELFVEMAQEPIWLEADATRLEQVLWNLLNNAAKYTEPGGRIWLSAGREGDDAVIRVRDSGMGIDPELLPRVFDLFTQADASLDRSQGGLGIGLALVRSLIEKHGGSVEGFSDGRGRGSEFVVRLPALPNQMAPVAPVRQAMPESAPAVRVMLVEDTRDAAETLMALLELWGHTAEVAYDGPAALKAVTGFQPDVVLLDIGLPGMDGYEVARHLRKMPGIQNAVLVALTGYGQEEYQRRAQDAGFDLLLTKPVDPRELQRLLSLVPSAHGISDWVSLPTVMATA